jgi:hypothetical protein
MKLEDILKALAGISAGSAVYLAADTAIAKPTKDVKLSDRDVVIRFTKNTPKGVLKAGEHVGLVKSEGNFAEREKEILCGDDPDCAQYRHENAIRRQLEGTNIFYLLGTIIRVENGKYAGGLDLYGIRGAKSGRSPDKRDALVNLVGVRGVQDNTTRKYNRDVNDPMHYVFAEYANIGNMIANARNNTLSNSDVYRLLLANTHIGEGIPGIDNVVVGRYDPEKSSERIVVDTSENGGSSIFDVWLLCQEKGACTGTNGKKIGHLAKVGSQGFRIGNGQVARHLMIEPCSNSVRVMYNDGTQGKTSVGVFAVPRDLYGTPVRVADSTPAPQVEPEDEAGDDTEPSQGQTPATKPATRPVRKKQHKPEPTPEPKPDLEGKVNPNFVLGVRGLYLPNNFMPDPAKVFQVEIGGRISENVYLLGLIGYGYAGSETIRDPKSRTNKPNPNDPMGIGGIFEASDSRTAHLIAAGLEVRYRPVKLLQLAIGPAVYFPIISSERSVSEKLLYPNGETVDQNSYKTSGTDVAALGGVTGGIDLRVSDNFSIGARGSFAAGPDGKQMYGGGVSLTGYFGGANNARKKK